MSRSGSATDGIPRARTVLLPLPFLVCIVLGIDVGIEKSRGRLIRLRADDQARPWLILHTAK